MQLIGVALIVCMAIGYLVWRYLNRAMHSKSCECENLECPLKKDGRMGADCDGCKLTDSVD